MEIGKEILLRNDDFGNEEHEASHYAEMEWDDLCDELTTLMRKRNPSGKWHAVMEGFGWQNRAGSMDFETTSGRILISKILPKADCQFRIYSYGPNGLAINNTHHDSPVWGKEWYYLTPAKSSTARRPATQKRALNKAKGSPSGMGGLR